MSTIVDNTSKRAILHKRLFVSRDGTLHSAEEGGDKHVKMVSCRHSRCQSRRFVVVYDEIRNDNDGRRINELALISYSCWHRKE